MIGCISKSILCMLAVVFFGCNRVPVQVSLTVTKPEHSTPTVRVRCTHAGKILGYEIEAREVDYETIEWEITPKGQERILVRLVRSERGWEFSPGFVQVPENAVITLDSKDEILVEFDHY